VSLAAPAEETRRRPAWRFVFVAAGVCAFVTGLWTGLVRLGWDLPAGAATLPALHGALMISAFFGTLISLERAVAIDRPWAYAAPAAAAVGALALLAGQVSFGGAALMAASLLLTANSITLVARLPALFTVLLAVAAALWVVGNAAWLAGAPMADVTGWWLAFLVLTIAAERLELSRLTEPPRWSQAVFVLAIGLVIAGVARGELSSESAPCMGAGLLVATAWLVRNDVAVRIVRQAGRTRFSAICMLAGYAWLGTAGVLLLAAPPATTAFGYDATVHAIAIGFVLSMVFGHAPIILPAVLGIRVGHGAALYLPLLLLHASVAIRVADLATWMDVRKGSAALTVLALVTYAVVLIRSGSARSAGAR
jgi:hypothetical protein